MSAQDAAELLNVSLATLYTYASRGRLRVRKTAGSRGSQYFRTDVERMRDGRGASRAAPGAVALTDSTAITLMTAEGSYYRGVSSVGLSQTASLEQTACLLWDTGGFDPFSEPPAARPTRWDRFLAVTAGLPALDRLAILLPVLRTADVRAHDTSPGGLWRAGARILRWSAAIMAGLPGPPGGPIHAAVAAALGHGPALEDAVRRVLVLGADQALEPTTYAVRATANTGATPYHCIQSGLAAASGGRLPSVRVGSFARFIHEIETAADPREPVLVRVREHEGLPGFGYTPAAFGGADPRAAALWSFLRGAMGGDLRFKRFEQAVALATEITGLHADFAFLAAWIGRSADGSGSLNLVRLGRIAGWLAHAAEQQLGRPLVRLAAAYNGDTPLGPG